ncbi:MAG TPA: hypothetical protein K8V56_02545 [Sporosarcina psychrophila]|uniref:Uncharacterized protein n=1 Tax=Sporosarcina psychrophila TaxID=1476 RepID=A0A921KD93_SPOPS|nr:hypothetical protein [Sporosarcina psychrophila]
MKPFFLVFYRTRVKLDLLIHHDFIQIGVVLTLMRIKNTFKQTFMILFLGILAFGVFFIRFSDLSNFLEFNFIQ